MKSLLTGIWVAIILIIVGYLTFQGITRLRTSHTEPTPSATVEPSSSPVPSASSKPTPAPVSNTPAKTYNPTTKKTGAVKGASTQTVTTTTTTTSHLFLTLIKTNACPAHYVSEVKDVQGPLTLKYSVRDNYDATITVWKQDNQEVLSKRPIRLSGEFPQIVGATYLKVEVNSTNCNATSDTWLTVTADR